MVNIQSITVVSERNTKIFNSAAENWAHMRSKATTARKRETHEKIRKLVKLNERITSAKYNVDEKKVEDIILIFGNTKETVHRLKDEYTRDLLFNENNKVIIVIFDIPPLYQVITTVYTSVGQEQIVSTTSSASPLSSRWET